MDARTMKTCRNCGKRKSLDGFYAVKSRGRVYTPSRCKPCYQIRSKTLTPEALYRERVARFWSYVDKGGPAHPVLKTCCWIWTRQRLPKGYGVACWQGKQALAHRVSWLLAHGAWPMDCALHKCDNPSCVRPDHLFEGTVIDNNRDMYQKGRDRKRGLKGEAHRRSKVTARDVREIRRLYASGAKQRDLGAQFGLGKTTIAHIVHRRSWAHVR